MTLESSVATETAATAPEGPRKRVCLLVLGMHRSGTSALTRVLSLMGAALPKTLMPPSPGNNDAGFWEPQVLVDYHDRILAELGSSWDDWRPLELGRLSVKRRDEIRTELLGLIDAEYGDAGLFVIKDPRISRFAGLYLETLTGAGVDCRCILVTRNPLEVVESLESRDGTLRAKAALLWLRHTLDAETATRSARRAIASYDGLLKDWQHTMFRLSEDLRTDFPYTPEDVSAQVERFLGPGHRHHARSNEDVLHEPAMRTWLADTHAAMQVLEANAGSAGALSTLDRVRREFDSAAPVLRGIEAEVSKQRAILAHREEEITRLQSEHSTAIADVTASMHRLDAAAANHLSLKDQEIGRLSALLADSTHQQNSLSQDLAVKTAEKLGLLASLADASSHAEMNLRRFEDAEQEKARIVANNRIDADKAAKDLSDREDSIAQMADSLRRTADTIELLRASIHASTQSPFGKIARMIRRISRPIAGMPIRLLPGHQVTLSSVQARATRWTMTGPDSQLLFDLGGAPLPPGHYVLTAHAPSGVEAFVRPQLFVDDGPGFSEATSIALDLKFRLNGRWSAMFTLPIGARELRFDPSVSSGNLSLTDIRIRKKTKYEHYVRLGAKIAKERVRTYSDAIAAMRRVRLSMAQGGLSKLALNLTAASAANGPRYSSRGLAVVRQPSMSLVNDDGSVCAMRPSAASEYSIAVPFPLAPTRPVENNPIAVIAHVFYPDLMPELIQYFGNINTPYKLFVSTDSDAKSELIREAIESSAEPPSLGYEVRVFPNRGRDIAPKIVGFKDVYTEFPVFLHVHSKKSIHGGQPYKAWRTHILDRLMGSREIFASNLALLELDDVGLVFPSHADLVRPLLNWGGNFEIARHLLARAGFSLNQMLPLEFPSGSMFLAKSAAIANLLSLDLEFSEFPPEHGQIDGTLAHAIERSMLYFVETAGFKWVRVGLSIGATPPQLIACNGPDDAHNNILQRFESISASNQKHTGFVAAKIPELTPFSFERDNSSRPRINLLVPTVNVTDIYGGIDSALRVFLDVSRHLDADVRVMVTDSDANGKLSPRLTQFTIQTNNSARNGGRTIVALGNRATKLHVRRNDVFFSSAWWTEYLSAEIHEYQKLSFGQPKKRFYIIQDFEPDFYGWSSKYALAESTYVDDKDLCAIINSEELYNFMTSKYTFSEAFVMPFEVNDLLNAAIKPQPREKKILFYARPSVLRNCYEVGMDGLILWQRSNPTEAAQWRILLAGENFQFALSSELANVELCGKVSLERYGELLGRCSVGLSLMLSPHPSYPPLEMAYSGISTVTNNFQNKQLSHRSGYIHCMDSVTPACVARALEDAVSESKPLIGTVTPVKLNLKSPYCTGRRYTPAILAASVEATFRCK